MMICVFVLRTKSQSGLRETFEDNAYATLIRTMPGPLPLSTVILLKSSCIMFYSEPNFGGKVLGCLPVGEHYGKDNTDIIKAARSFKIPSKLLLQIYGRSGEYFSQAGRADIAVWQPPTWDILRLIIYSSDLTGSDALMPEIAVAPEPVWDDWRHSDGNVIKAYESDADQSDIPRFDIKEIYSSTSQ